jgi:iron complex transport system substrate-binding protein
MRFPPERIVCLTEETVETLYLLGAGDRVVGVSAYVERPPEAKAKPTVCSFIKARPERIVELEPDLVLAFSDLQGEIVRDLLGRGLTVVGFNQRSIAEILAMVRTLGRLTDLAPEADALADRLEAGLDDARARAAARPRRPRVFFEEWHDPLISSIRWVSEIVEACGGDELFPEHARASLAKDRIVSPDEVRRRDPELVLASWCGKKVEPELIRARPGWSEVSAIAADRIVEIDSTIILQPGPAALTDGLAAVEEAIAAAAVEL